MKTTKLVALGLVGLTALALGGQIANAAAIDKDPISANSNGTVQFTTKDVGEVPNPEGPGTVDPEGKPGGGSNTTDPDLKLMFVPNFVFGTVGSYDAQGNQVDFKSTVNYDAIIGDTYVAQNQIVDIYDADGTKTDDNVQMANFAQVYNSEKITDWKLTVTATEFASGAKTQPKMLMTLNNVTVADGVSQYGTLATVSGSASKALTPGEAVEIGSFSDAATEGAVNSFMFGPATGQNAGVSLDVPRGLNIENNETYTSNMTWTAVSTVQ